MSDTTADALDRAPESQSPWFQIDATRHPLAWFPGAVAPVTLAAAFDDRVLPLALDAVRMPHDRATRDRLEIECREVAAMLVKVAEEDGHPFMLAAALHALVRRIAESEARA